MVIESVNHLEQAVKTKFTTLDLASEHVGYIVEALLYASLRGIDTHGVELAPFYFRELSEGRSKIRPKLEYDVSGSLIRFDADDALGIVAGVESIDKGVDLALSKGLSLVSVKNSNHYGAASFYTQRAANKNLIALSFCNADSLIAPAFGVDKILGTNPLSVAAPALNGDGFCLDLASSGMSYTKIKGMLEKGADIPKGYAIDANGVDSSESGLVSALLPFGGVKGQGISMIGTIMAGILNCMPLDNEMSHFYAEPFSEPRKTGHLFILVNPEYFCGAEYFKQQLQTYLDTIRNSKSRLKTSPVRIAGDLERKSYEERIVTGIPVTDSLRMFLGNAR